MSFETAGDLALVRAVRASKPGAWEAFVQRTGDVVYTSCCAFFAKRQAEAELEVAYVRLRADGFAALARFDGRADLEKFVALQVERGLGLRIAEMIEKDTAAAWAAFERGMARIVKGAIRRHAGLMPGQMKAGGTGTLDDLYQDFCGDQAIKRDYAALRQYKGEAGYRGYIADVVRRWFIDQTRKTPAGQRWREPKAVQGMSKIEREIYAARDRHGRTKDEVLEQFAEYPADRVKAALKQVDPHLRQRAKVDSLTAVQADGVVAERELVDPAEPVDERLDRAQKLQMIFDAVEQLPAELKLYAQLWLRLETPDAVADHMGRPVKEIYRLQERLLRVLEIQLGEGTPGAEKAASVRPSV